MIESRNPIIFLRQNRGQGSIEYILLLVITVAIVLLAISNVFKPMQTFMKGYMGTYISCLLSSGELPKLKSESSGLSEDEPMCNINWKGGKDSLNAANGGTSGANKNGSEGDGDSKNGKRKKGAGGDSSSGSGGAGASSSRASYAGVNSRMGGFGRNNRSGADGGAAVAAEEGGKKTYLNNLNGNKKDRYFRTTAGQRRSANYRESGIAISSLTEEDKKKIERKIQQEAKRVVNNEEFSVLPKKHILKPIEKAKIKLDDNDEPMTVGGFFKYILIAIIILLIIIIGGGQIFEMSKSSSK